MSKDNKIKFDICDELQKKGISEVELWNSINSYYGRIYRIRLFEVDENLDVVKNANKKDTLEYPLVDSPEWDEENIWKETNNSKFYQYIQDLTGTHNRIIVYDIDLDLGEWKFKINIDKVKGVLVLYNKMGEPVREKHNKDKFWDKLKAEVLRSM